MITLEKEMFTALNKQIYEESNSAYIYAGMAAWLGGQKLRGMEKWMIKQVEEELEHTEKLYRYVTTHGTVTLETLSKPQNEWGSALKVFEAALEHEKYITGCIKDLAEKAEAIDDKETREFLQWYIDEQVEEEENATNNVNNIKAAGDDLSEVDKKMGGR